MTGKLGYSSTEEVYSVVREMLSGLVTVARRSAAFLQPQKDQDSI